MIMAYEKQTWIDGQSPLNAERMNHIENGLGALDEEKSSQAELDVTNGIATDAVRAMANKVKKYQRPDSLTIVADSDAHYTADNENAGEYLSGFRRMAQLGDFFHTDIVSNFGDLIPGKDVLDVAKRDLMDIVGAIAHNCRSMVAIVRGNHDDNGWYSQGGFGGSYKPDEMLDALGQYQYIDSLNVGMVRDPANLTGGYGYFDHEASKIRVFQLNTSDIPYVLKDDGSYRYTTYGWAAFSNAQINFVANALKFEDKDEPNDWAALFLMHIPMDTTNDDGYRFGIKDALIRGHLQMLGVIGAYKNGSQYHYSGSVYNASTGDIADDFMVTVLADYTTKGAGDVVGFLSGHTHADNYSNEIGIDRSPSRGYAYLSIKNVGAFVVNRADSSITLVKYGQGVPDKTVGASVVAPAQGSVESGEWTVYFDQFRPEIANIFGGWDSRGFGYIIGDNSTIDLQTMELKDPKEDAKYITSKAVPVTPSTTYKIPSGWSGLIGAFKSGGNKSGYLTPTESADGGYKMITTTASQYYLVFSAHVSYGDYENMSVVRHG